MILFCTYVRFISDMAMMTTAYRALSYRAGCQTISQTHLQALKDKVGNRSNASSEIEYDRAYARAQVHRDEALERSLTWSLTRDSIAWLPVRV